MIEGGLPCKYQYTFTVEEAWEIPVEFDGVLQPAGTVIARRCSVGADNENQARHFVLEAARLAGRRVVRIILEKREETGQL